MTRMVLRLCSYLPHSTAPTPISSVTTIIDLDQVSLTSLWNWRKHFQEASTLATANYPETLSTIVVVNSPSFFPTVWGWIKVRRGDCDWMLNSSSPPSPGSTKGRVTKYMFSGRIQGLRFEISSMFKIFRNRTGASWIGVTRMNRVWTMRLKLRLEQCLGGPLTSSTVRSYNRLLGLMYMKKAPELLPRLL